MGSLAPTHNTPLQVFVVEDSAAVRERLLELVDSIDGARCTGYAGTASAAIEGIRSLRPDAVILDLRLAEGNGFDVMRALRDDGPGPDFYVLSSFAIEPYRRLALRMGAAAFLDKVTELSAIRDLIAQRAMRHSVSTN
jgi:DNA-binding NarL/FixJ family response regulator